MVKDVNATLGHRLRAATVFVLMIAVGSCDDTFEPLQENDRYVFSMYGSLDILADTQWVRIMPIGKSLLPETVDDARALVELTRLSDGSTVILEDSVFVFGGGTPVLNYYTDQKIHPDETYRLVAKSTDGRTSQVMVKTPKPMPMPYFEYDVTIDQGFIEGTVTDSIVSAYVIYTADVVTEQNCIPDNVVIVTHTEDVYYYDDVYRLSFRDRGSVAGRLGVQPGQVRIVHREAVIVTATDSWPRLAGLTGEEMVLPDVVTNVEGGTGFVAGIARRRFALAPRGSGC